jgi:hypothetical protein
MMRKRAVVTLSNVIVILIVSIMLFVVMAIFVFPGVGQGVKDFLGLAKSCKDPGKTIGKYMDDVDDSLIILQGITAISDTGQRVDIQIDADEFAIGIDQEMFVCAKEGVINKSDLERFESSDFGPEDGDPPPRKIEIIYRDFIKNLADKGQPGTLKDLKRYIKWYKERFDDPVTITVVPEPEGEIVLKSETENPGVSTEVEFELVFEDTRYDQYYDEGYAYYWDFGDETDVIQTDSDAPGVLISHTYDISKYTAPPHGIFNVSVKVWPEDQVYPWIFRKTVVPAVP